jgi:glutamate-1-semialdehyde 2,1-aminomutase
MGMQNLLDQEMTRFSQKTKKSRELYDRNRSITPSGVHSNYRVIDPYPLFMSHARLSRIWDVDGNEYIDYNMGFGSLGVGHSNPLLVEALSGVLSRGTIYGFETEDAYRLGKLIIERYGVDKVRFSNTGLEATMHALRIARAFTSRKKIIKFEGCYHGSHDAVLVSIKPSLERAGDPRNPNRVPSSAGIPEEFIANTLVAPYNDLQATEEILRKNRDDVAAVILEPIPMNMGFVMPRAGFLEGLRKMCDEMGCLLIFDEVKTGGKFYRGAAGYFGVKPDLMILGKAIAGGIPLSVIGGNRDVMDTIVPGKLAHAGTFNSNPLSVNAALVTLGKILTEEAYSRLEKHNEALGRGYTDIFNDERINVSVRYAGVSGCVGFGNEVYNWRDFLKNDVGAWWSYYFLMVNRGIIPCGTGPDEQWTVSVAHTQEDLESHLEVLKEVTQLIKHFKVSMDLVEAI